MRLDFGDVWCRCSQRIMAARSYECPSHVTTCSCRVRGRRTGAQEGVKANRVQHARHRDGALGLFLHRLSPLHAARTPSASPCFCEVSHMIVGYASAKAERPPCDRRNPGPPNASSAGGILCSRRLDRLLHCRGLELRPLIRKASCTHNEVAQRLVKASQRGTRRRAHRTALSKLLQFRRRAEQGAPSGGSNGSKLTRPLPPLHRT
jgi:hypothetical protein